MTASLNLSRRLRRTPFTERAEACGVSGFTVVNHMLLPKAYRRSIEEDYWHLRQGVQLWDVACQRQVQVHGPDAARLVQWMTPRDLRGALPGQCLYVPLVDGRGGLVNDPVLLKLDSDLFWLSIADSDVLLWARGLALGAGLDVTITEPDVSPLAVQGPRALDLMVEVFGDGVRALKYFGFARFEFQHSHQVVARSGYSSQDGFEIYLDGGALGGALWDALWEAGQAFDVAPGCPNLIDRIEAGLLSYGNDMTLENNPFECGMARHLALDGSLECIGGDALRAIQREGARRRITGVTFGSDPCPACASPWPVTGDGPRGERIGQVTSAAYSPRLRRNVGLAMIERGFWDPGQGVSVHCPGGEGLTGELTALPFVGRS